MSVNRHQYWVFLPAMMFLAWLVQRGCAWLVYHDAIYYKLSDAGFRWLTNLAEVGFFLGPISFLAIGFGAGIILVFGLWIWNIEKP